MSDIKQAAKWMQEGKRVESFSARRSSGIYAREQDGEFFTMRTGIRVRLTMDDLLADDWEIASEN
jgi:hypothetical protein